jgi:hypothetical protein
VRLERLTAKFILQFSAPFDHTLPAKQKIYHKEAGQTTLIKKRTLHGQISGVGHLIYWITNQHFSTDFL